MNTPLGSGRALVRSKASAATPPSAVPSTPPKAPTPTPSSRKSRLTREGVKPFPPTGYRTLDARSAFFYGITGITPAMSMRLPGIGSQYLFATLDADKHYFDGAKTYKVTLPRDIPQAVQRNS